MARRVSMRQVGIREFKNQATAMISSGETLVIERHGKPVGFFVPIAAKDRRTGRAALGRLGQILETVLAETGLSEEELVIELTEARRR
jgi:antitoxin (DNA-binding transcriptional repressor) of toxin-antitoxin stability system